MDQVRNGFGPLLGHAAHLARERMDARLARFDVTPAQTHVLLYLYRNGGERSQQEIVEHLRVKPPTANGILERMEEKGLVAREINSSDARRKSVRLTERGEELRQLMQKTFFDAEETLTRGITPEEQTVLHEILEKIIGNLEEDRKLC